MVLQGSTGVAEPCFDPDRSWLYVVARDHSQGYRSAPAVVEEGRQYIGGVPFPAGDAAGGANRNFVLATDTTTGEVMWKYPIVRGSFAAGVLRTGGGIVFAATAAGDLGRSRFWIGQAALVFPNRSYDRFFSDKRFGRRKAVCGDCPAAGAQRCTEQVEYFHHPSSPLTAIVAQFKLPLFIRGFITDI